jgi:hypothetical protein
MKSLVTISIPSYNSEAYIKSAKLPWNLAYELSIILINF